MSTKKEWTELSEQELEKVAGGTTGDGTVRTDDGTGGSTAGNTTIPITKGETNSDNSVTRGSQYKDYRGQGFEN